MKKIPYGVDNFRELREGNYYFVDKTYVIEEILKSGSEVPAYLRPNGFGKSLFISMLECFFDIDKRKENEHLFDGLKIKESEYFKEFGKYPVIHLDLKTLKYDDFESNYQELKNVMSNIYKEKMYLEDFLDEWELKNFRAIINKTADSLDYERSLKNLSQWLERYHHQKTIILVDEYDTPIQQGYKNGFYDKIVNPLYSMLDSSLKGNDSLSRGFMTGVLKVQNADIFGGLNNLDICDLMTKRYNDAFGFTEEETKELLEYYGLKLTEEVKNMYDGYNFSGTSIYNPWSILNYASKKVLEPYWMNTSGNVLIKKLLSDISEKDKIMIEKLLKGESVSFGYDNRMTYRDFNETKDITKVLNLLFASGYLTFDKEEIDDISGLKYHYFKIPNEEVKINLAKMIQSITFQSELLETNNYKDFIRNIILGEHEKIEEYLNELLPSLSFYETKENFYHGYMLSLFSGFLTNLYIVKSNRETGTGRYDVMVRKQDRSFGCIFEFKIADKEEDMESLASIAKEQMKEKEYYKELELDKVQNIKEYAVVFFGKKCIVK